MVLVPADPFQVFVKEYLKDIIPVGRVPPLGVEEVIPRLWGCREMNDEDVLFVV
jgi:hypothetical protein